MKAQDSQCPLNGQTKVRSQEGTEVAEVPVSKHPRCPETARGGEDRKVRGPAWGRAGSRPHSPARPLHAPGAVEGGPRSVELAGVLGRGRGPAGPGWAVGSRQLQTGPPRVAASLWRSGHSRCRLTGGSAVSSLAASGSWSQWSRQKRSWRKLRPPSRRSPRPSCCDLGAGPPCSQRAPCRRGERPEAPGTETASPGRWLWTRVTETGAGCFYKENIKKLRLIVF